MGNLFNVFEPSPIGPIEKHMRKATQCAQALYPLVEAVNQQDWDVVAAVLKKIETFEKEADRIKRDLRLHLPKGLFLPVARTDLLELLAAQDVIANKSEHIAQLIYSRKMQIPPVLIPLFMPFLQRCIDTAQQACKAINELDELLETSFRGNELKIVEGMIMTLDEIEHDCDEKLADLRQAIFALEQDFPPLEIIFLYKLVQWIGDLADQAQTVGGKLQILIAR